MSVYTSLFISLCFNAYVSLYSLLPLILLNRVAWLVLLFEFFSLINGNGFGLSVCVKISTFRPGNSISTCARVGFLLFNVVAILWQAVFMDKYVNKVYVRFGAKQSMTSFQFHLLTTWIRFYATKVLTATCNCKHSATTVDFNK